MSYSENIPTFKMSPPQFSSSSSDIIPTFKMSPPQFSSSSSDIIQVMPQFSSSSSDIIQVTPQFSSSSSDIIQVTPQFSSSSSDVIQVTPQFPMSNESIEHSQRFEHHQRFEHSQRFEHHQRFEHSQRFEHHQQRFEPRFASDHSHSFKRPRMYDNSHSDTRMGPPPRMDHPPSNRQTGNIFFKTRICTKFGFGTCRNGENCTFAHGAGEIRQPPPNWQELVGPRTEERLQLGGSRNEDEKIIQKMKLCKKYCNGEICPYGDKCNFLHENPAKFRDDSWKTSESSAISIENIGSPKSFGNGSNNLEGNRAGTKPAWGTNWKSKICLKWINTGSCPFGDNCHFAHGDAELQVPARGIEAEAAVAITNSTKAVIPGLLTSGSSVNDAPTTLPANVPAAMEEEKKAKKELLWKKLNKINHIYGDWI